MTTMTFVFTRLATQEISSAGLLLKADGATYADLCGAGDDPIGVSTHSCGVNHVQTVRALAPGIVSLRASDAIAFGADCGLDTGGKVCSWSSGLKIGRAVSAATLDGDEIAVAVASSSDLAVAQSTVGVTISADVPTAAPGVPSGTSAFVLHYDGSFLGLYFWNGAAWEQLT